MRASEWIARNRARNRLAPLVGVNVEARRANETERIHALLDEGLAQFQGSQEWRSMERNAVEATEAAERERYGLREPEPEIVQEPPAELERRYLRSKADVQRAENLARLYEAAELERQRRRLG
jgi:hypothetical protein